MDELINMLASVNADEQEHSQVDWDLIEIIEAERGRTCPR